MCNLGGTANLPIRRMATTATIFLVLVLVGVILSGVSIIVGIVSIVALSHRRVVTLSSSLLLVLTAFAAAIALTSVIAAAVVVATNAAAAALHQWLVVVLPTPLSVILSVIRHLCYCASINTFAAGRRPLSPTFPSRCPIHRLCRSHRWLVVVFSAHPIAY